MSEIEDALARVKAYADELDRRYAASEHMLGLGDGAGYYDLIADEIRDVLRVPEVRERS